MFVYYLIMFCFFIQWSLSLTWILQSYARKVYPVVGVFFNLCGGFFNFFYWNFVVGISFISEWFGEWGDCLPLLLWNLPLLPKVVGYGNFYILCSCGSLLTDVWEMMGKINHLFIGKWLNWMNQPWKRSLERGALKEESWKRELRRRSAGWRSAGDCIKKTHDLHR